LPQCHAFRQNLQIIYLSNSIPKKTFCLLKKILYLRIYFLSTKKIKANTKMKGYSQIPMIPMLRTEKARNLLIMSELLRQAVDYQAVTCLYYNYIADIQSVNKNRLPLAFF
jgi:hypothetical protein